MVRKGPRTKKKDIFVYFQGILVKVMIDGYKISIVILM